MEDRFGHRISYLRVSVTDRCNERCAYCMPQELQEWLPRAEILSYEETLRLLRIAAGLGVTKVRITGGEPLTRRGIVDFIRDVPKIPGIRDVGVSTNGTLLAREITPNQTIAAALRAAGVRSHGGRLRDRCSRARNDPHPPRRAHRRRRADLAPPELGEASRHTARDRFQGGKEAKNDWVTRVTQFAPPRFARTTAPRAHRG